MGKVVATLGALGLAVAVAALAPGLGLTVSFILASSQAVGTAIAAVGLSLLGGLVLQQIGSNPANSHSLTPTQARTHVRVVENFGWRDIPRDDPEPLPIAPVQISLIRSPLLALKIWVATWVYGTRFSVVRNVGDCMQPMLPQGQWVLIDNARAAQPGDAISFMTDDLFTSWIDDMPLSARLRASGMIKQYLGLADDGQVIVFRSLNEPVTGHAGIARLQYLHVVRSSHASWLGAVRALLQAAFRD